MGINITQFAPPGKVSNLVWDEDMKPGTGKIFKGDLTGNVTGNVTGDVTGVLNGGIDAKYSLSQTPHALTFATVIPKYSSNAKSGVFVKGLRAAIQAIDAITPACAGIFNNQGATYPFTLVVATRSDFHDSQTTYKTYDEAGTELSSVAEAPGRHTFSIDETVDKITYSMDFGKAHSASFSALYAVFK